MNLVARLLMPTAAVFAVVIAPPSHADETAGPHSAMGADLRTYYGGERLSGEIVTALGALSIGAGGAMVTRDSDFARGLGWPLLTLGSLEVIGGIYYAFRVGAQIRQYEGRLTRDPAAYKREESARIESVRSRFPFYRVTELAFTLAGAGIATYGIASKRDTWTGVGVGVTTVAFPFFVIDTINQGRAARYAEQLRGFDPSVSVQVGGADRPWTVSVGGKF